MNEVFVNKSEDFTPLHFVTKESLSILFDDLTEAQVTYLESTKFVAERMQVALLPSVTGNIERVLFGLGDTQDAFLTGCLSQKLPSGCFEIVDFAGCDQTLTTLAIFLGAYRFDRYRTEGRAQPAPQFVWPKDCDRSLVESMVEGIYLTRDLVNTPAADMGPEDLGKAAEELGGKFGADVKLIVGDDLLKENLPLVHAVGRANPSAPRLIDMRWGREGAPKVTLVGKGVCFDTGGLNLKTGPTMALMKKDMGGAANVLGLASMIMSQKLNVRLHVLIPAVENSVAGPAFRPGDVLKSRKGLTVEIGNTDAEGRVVLADALTVAEEEEPDLIIDLATLTGAARVALGPDLPALYCNDETFISEANEAMQKTGDPFWRMPLWTPYLEALSSKIADLNNITTDGFAGSVTAALFLQKFVEKAPTWVHVDLYAWNPEAKPSRPFGGEAQVIRTLFEVLRSRYG